jgi:hypothetical protein
VRALAIRLDLGVPEAGNNLRRLADYRGDLGSEHSGDLLTKATTGVGLSAETIVPGRPVRWPERRYVRPTMARLTNTNPI